MESGSSLLWEGARPACRGRQYPAYRPREGANLKATRTTKPAEPMHGARTGADTAQRKLAATPGRQEHARLSHGLTTARHGALQAAIDQSPRMLAQRRTIDAAFGNVRQHQTDGLEDEKPLQARMAESSGSSHASAAASQAAIAAPVNQTGMPNQLKAGIESLSGMDLSDVRVHRNSGKPAQLNALAYAQGNDIHLGPGQEQHLPHEAWHVVQQRQGRVNTTMQMAGGVAVNDDVGLEREADVMGRRAVLQGAGMGADRRKDLTPNRTLKSVQLTRRVTQMVYMPLAEDYEARLGKYLFNHPRASAAARGAVKAMAGVMRVSAVSGTAGQVFGGDDPRYPGNVGRDAGRVWDAVKNGNLRERMTGFYNASLGPFKTLLSDRINGVGEWEGRWAAATKDLRARGLNKKAHAAIATRRNQIQAGGGDKMKDLYIAPGDFTLRADHDALYRAQSIIPSRAPRLEAMDQTDPTKLNALRIHGLNELTVTDADLANYSHNAMLGNHLRTSTYEKIRRSLLKVKTALGGTTQAPVLRALSKLRTRTYTWLKDNTGMVDLVKKFRGTQGEAMRKITMLRERVQSAIGPMPAGIIADPATAPDEEYNWINAADFAGLDPADFRVDRSALAGSHAGYLGDAGEETAYNAVIATMTRLHAAATMRDKAVALMQLQAQVEQWVGGDADTRLLATANRDAVDEHVKKRVIVERLRSQLDKVYSATGRTNADLQTGALDARLSPNEQAFLMETHAADYDAGGGVFNSAAVLPWEEGGTRYKPNLANTWSHEAQTLLKMPVVSGASGTTDRMYQALKYLGNPVDGADFRLALLGWMLSSGDHSFHEIMAVAASYGQPYTPGPKSYRTLPPLTERELREHVCLHPGYLGLFPDEVDYHRSMKANRFALYKPVMEDLKLYARHSVLAQNQTGLDAAAYKAAGLPKLLRNVTAYTTKAYAVQNIVADHSALVAKRMIGSLLSEARKLPRIVAWLGGEEGEDDHERQVQLQVFKQMPWAEQHMVAVVAHTPTITADQLYEEALRHNEFTAEAMSKLPNYAGVVWRGQSVVSLTSNLSDFKQHKTFTINKFMSAAKTDANADFYAEKSRGDVAKWYSRFKRGVILRIVSQHAKSVDSVSVNERKLVRAGLAVPETQEVVFLPGTTFRVDVAPRSVEGKTAPQADISEQ